MNRLSKITPSKPQVFSTSDLTKILGSKQKIFREVKLNRLNSLGSGYYCTPSMTSFEASLLITARYYPNAVVSGLSALKVHGLLENEPAQMEADIQRSTNLKNRLIKFRRVTEKRLIGQTEIKVHEASIKIYDVERSLAELLLLPNLSSLQIEKCWEKYVKINKINLKKLKEYGKVLGVDLIGQFEEAKLQSDYLEKTHPKANARSLILEQAIHLFAEKGTEGFTLEGVANRIGMQLETVLFYFSNKKELIQEVHKALGNMFSQTFGKEIYSLNIPPKDFVVRLMEGAFKIIEADELAYRIRQWSYAENSDYAKQIIEGLVSDMVANIKIKIEEEVPNISEGESETRATLLGSVCHTYSVIFWYYSYHLKVKSSRQAFLDNFKKGVVKNLIDACFLPPSW